MSRPTGYPGVLTRDDSGMSDPVQFLPRDLTDLSLSSTLLSQDFRGSHISTGGGSVGCNNGNTTFVNVTQNFSESPGVLGKLPHIQDGYRLHAGCDDGTRTDIINEVIKWAESPQKDIPQIFWLLGMAGEGKSTITTSVARHLKGSNRLGASFFFSRYIHECSLPNKVFSSIAFHLSHFDPIFGKKVSEVLKSIPIPGDLTPGEQFEQFVLEPILAIKEHLDPSRLIFIVMDGLDECGNEDDRKEILESLAQFTKLPITFRLFLSSRPVKDIQRMVDGMGNAVQKCDIGRDAAVEKDISAFIARRTQDIRPKWPSLHDWPDWPGNKNHEALVNRACCLFIWASTAMKFIDEEDPHGQLKFLLDAPISPLTTLDDLYTIVLEQAYTKQPTDRRLELFQKIFSIILVVANPVPLSVLGQLIGIGYERRASGVLRDVLSNLRSVVSISDNQDIIRIIHPSFADFLIDGTRSKKFAIDLGRRHADFAIYLLKLIKVHGKDNNLEQETISYITKFLPYHFRRVFMSSPDPEFLGSVRSILEDLSQLLRQLHYSESEWYFRPDTSEILWEQMISELQQWPQCRGKIISLLRCIKKFSSFLRIYHTNQSSVPFAAHHTIIAVMGDTGVGKSSFINLAIGQALATVDHTLQSGTSHVSSFACHVPIDGRNVILVDTPGFDNTFLTEADIVNRIEEWLDATYSEKISVGVVLLHAISETRMRSSSLRSLSAFQKLCGSKILQNVILVTTMWDETTDDDHSRREQELQSTFWKPLIKKGARVARFHNTQESAWEIIKEIRTSLRRDKGRPRNHPLRRLKELISGFRHV